jgi:2-dehydro-3-deoxyphosphooctonate aldolase (KDO 8-P synthase)
MTMHNVNIGSLNVANNRPLTLIAGPCAMENRNHALKTAQILKSLTDNLGIGLIYKSSFDKANRTSVDGLRGIGMDEALDVFDEIRETYGCPVITDVHEPWQCEKVAKSVDVLQIPAYLCRQTDLLVAAGETGCAINVKKGQFLAPWDMVNVIGKIESTGNRNIMLCERGASFGYNTLVSDMRSIPILSATGYPVVFDATHSVQQPGGQGGHSGGQREFAPVLARAAISIGVAAVFIETHEDPDSAPSDGPNMIPLDKLSGVLESLMAFDKLAKDDPVDLDALR